MAHERACELGEKAGVRLRLRGARGATRGLAGDTEDEHEKEAPDPWASRAFGVSRAHHRRLLPLDARGQEIQR